jgi:hypothetical protein
MRVRTDITRTMSAMTRLGHHWADEIVPLNMLTSRIVTTCSGHIALQHLLTIYGIQAIALALRKRFRRL